MLLENALLLIQVFLLIVLVLKENVGKCTEKLQLARPHKLLWDSVPIAANTITSDALSEGENRPEDHTLEDALYAHMRSATAV